MHLHTFGVAAAVVSLCVVMSATVSAQPLFTGHPADDFSVPGAIVIDDAPLGRDVGLPLAAPPGTVSGWDMQRAYLHYDPVSDVLSVGLETLGIAGDADGDGDEGTTAPWLMDGGVDDPLFGGTESVAITLDTDLDGLPDVIAGVPALTDISGFAVATFSGSPFTPGFAFGAPLPGHEGFINLPASAGAPHAEFTIESFSLLPGFVGGALEFGFRAYTGSFSDGGIGEDHLPYTLVTLPECAASDATCDGVDDDCDGHVDEDVDGFVYEVEQGGVAYQIVPLENSRIDTFYAYGSPESASANTGLEMSDTAVIALHREPSGEMGLLFIIDAVDDGTGGNLELDITGLPASASLEVEDDPSGGADSYDLGGGHFEWTWFRCCTDGLAIGQLPADLCITLHPGQMAGVAQLAVVPGPGIAPIILGDTSSAVTICATQCCADTVDITCDGVDDDCDGEIDDDYTPAPTLCGTGYCEQSGLLQCVGGELVAQCAPGSPRADDPTCDGIDTDCDGMTDEDYVPPPAWCGVGACAADGVVACIDGAPIEVCEPGLPTGDDTDCDGVDDDCDGVWDEHFPVEYLKCGEGACLGCGNVVCVDAQIYNTCEPTPPIGDDANCDGVDDDCDGETDEHFVASQAVSCGFGACQGAGVLGCVGGQLMPVCDESAPTGNDDECDGVDDDCDGMTDEHFDVQASTCGLGVCASQGQLVCVAGALVDTCVVGSGLPADTICDGADNDCDGATDEDHAPTPTTCGIGYCAATGALVCQGGALVDTCSPLPPLPSDATCDGLDDDCDGVTDGGFGVAITYCGVGVCAGQGFALCYDGELQMQCRVGTPAFAEVCQNGIDDDCDGATDSADVCECGPPPNPTRGCDPSRVVCGCDGQTWSSECAAHDAGVKVEHHGVCGGPCTDNDECPNGQYCNREGCTETGVCEAMPETCATFEADELLVCDCDGATWLNACSPAAAGISMLHDGACEL